MVLLCGAEENGESCIIHNLFFSTTVMISSRRKLNGQVVGTEDMRKAYKFYVGKLEAKRPSISIYFPFKQFLSPMLFKSSLVYSQAI
jgi:hypothetical protein